MHRLLRSLVAFGVALALPPAAVGLDSWTTPPAPTGVPALETIAFGNGLFVAGGSSGTYATSLDGSAWTARSLPAQASGGLNRIAFESGTFVGVGSEGCILTSPDGLNWTVRDSGTAAALVAVTAAGDRRWVALGQSGENAVVLESPDDGVTWMPRPAGAFTPHGLTFGQGWFVSAASSGLGTDIRRSYDLSTWESALGYDMGAMLRASAYGAGAGGFVAVGDAGRLLHSSNGASWQAASSGVAEDLAMVKFLDGQFVAVGEGERIISSNDGQSWQARGAPSESTGSLRDIAFGNHAWVAVGWQQESWWDPPTPAILVSDAAVAGRIAFSSASVGVDETEGVVTIEVQRTGAAAGAVTADYFTMDGTAVAGSDFEDASGTLAWGDGDSSPRTISIQILEDAIPEGSESFTLILHNAGGGALLGSPSEAIWTIQGHLPPAEWHARGGILQSEDPASVAFGNGLTVLVGDSGAIATSADGFTWINRRSGTTRDLHAVAFGNGHFIAVGDEGTVLISADGKVWLAGDAGTVETLLAIGFGAGNFVAVGAGGVIVTSSDGAEWIRAESGSLADLGGIAFGNGGWLATGAEGAALWSTDGGSSWSDRSAPLAAGGIWVGLSSETAPSPR